MLGVGPVVVVVAGVEVGQFAGLVDGVESRSASSRYGGHHVACIESRMVYPGTIAITWYGKFPTGNKVLLVQWRLYSEGCEEARVIGFPRR